jgi:nucleoside-diphosphate-sugar epimerase
MGLPDMDACIHFAWSGVGVKGRMDPDIQEVNVRNTMQLIQAAGELKCGRLLFAGSQAEYGVTEERIRQKKCADAPVTENQECHPISEYGKAKLRVLSDGSTLADMLNMAYIHMRIFSVYGAGDHGTSLISSCLHAALSGEEAILGPCTQRWNYLYITDCAKAVADLTESTYITSDDQNEAEDSVVNVAGEDTRILSEFVKDIFRTAGTDGKFKFADRTPWPEGTPWLYPDTEKLRELTGFSPEVSFTDGIEKCIKGA